MSEFVFANPRLPRKLAQSATYALAGMLALVALSIFLVGQSTQSSNEQKRSIIARAEAQSGGNQTEFDNSAFFTGDTPQLAQAAFQTDLQALADRHNLKIEVIRADQIEQIDGYIRLNLTINGIAPEEELGAFLTSFAEHRPLVIVDSLNLRRARASRSEPERRVAFQTKLYGMMQR